VGYKLCPEPAVASGEQNKRHKASRCVIGGMVWERSLINT